MKLNLGEIDVSDAGLSKNQNRKWTGKKTVSEGGKEYCVLITVVEQQAQRRVDGATIPSYDQLNELISKTTAGQSKPLSVEAYNAIISGMKIK